MTILERNKEFVRGYQGVSGYSRERALGWIVAIGKGFDLGETDQWQLGFLYGLAEIVATIENLPAEKLSVWK